MLLFTFLAENCWQPHSTGQVLLLLFSRIPPHPSFYLNWEMWFWYSEKMGITSIHETQQPHWQWGSIPLSDIFVKQSIGLLSLLVQTPNKALPILFPCSSKHHKDIRCFLSVFSLLLACTSSSSCSIHDTNTHSISLATKSLWFPLKLHCVVNGIFPPPFSLKVIFYFHLNFQKSWREGRFEKITNKKWGNIWG